MGKTTRRPQKAESSAPEPAAAAVPDRRQLVFDDGKSRKFWNIERNGSHHTVHFGRIGTVGQTQTKEFGSAAEAQAAYEKLVAEKVKKGYQAAEEASPPAAPNAKRPAAPKVKEDAPPTEEDRPAAAPAPIPAPALPKRPPQRHAEVTHLIDLDPDDWLWATWRIGTPLPESAGKREAPGVERTGEHRYYADGPSWNHEPGFTHSKLKQLLEPSRRPGMVSRILEMLDKRAKYEDVHGSYYYDADFADAFRWNLLPHLAPAELDALRTGLRQRLAQAQLPTKSWERMPPAAYLAARVGMPQEIAELLQHFDEKFFSSASNRLSPQTLVLGLGSPEEVIRELRRLRLRLSQGIDDRYVRGWLACTEFAALDKIRDDVLAGGGSPDLKLVVALALVRAPEAAAPMLELSLSPKTAKLALAWLEQEPGNAIAGLIPVAAGRGKLAEPALEFLRQMKAKGYGDFIAACLDGAEPGIDAKIQAEVLRDEPVYPVFDAATTPAWLQKGLKAEPAKGAGDRPEWASPAKLPPLIAGGHRLSDEQVEAVLSSLARSELADRPLLFQELRAHADRDALDKFLWRLFENWLQDGAPREQRWALRALGHLGSDAIALRLAPLVRQWPGENQHPRAVQGLECLRAIGSDTALIQLNGIAQKVKFKGLKARAATLMEEIAAERKLSRAQLEDRIVPDCDLDERGTRVFDFGPRQFRFVFGPELKPMVRDDSGALKSDLPKPAAKDDPERANAAVAEWKLLKKQVREAAKVQVERLEQAMVTGRRWPLAEFEALIVRQPLMTNLARLLVWGGYDESGRLVRTFRVTEDRDYADIHDAACRLAGLASVGIVHPLHLSAEQRAAWGELFADYEIVPPFPQLGRAVYRLEGGETQGREITRFRKLKTPAPTLVFTLEKLGWLRATPKDNGTIDHHRKPFPGAGVTAFVTYGYGGPSVNFIMEAPDQDIEHCYFLAGTDHSGNSWYDHSSFLEKALPLDQVDPVAVSEVLGDLSAIAAKGKR